MKNKKYLKRFLSMLLSVLLITQIIPISVLAEEYAEYTDSITETIEEPTVVAEVKSERTEYTKHFRMSDGTYIAATYPEPVHYEVNGKWVDIDNSLSQETVDGISVYKNNKSKHSVSFSESIEDKGVTIKKSNGYEISFVPETNEKKTKVKGKKKDTKDLESVAILNAEEKLDIKSEKMAAKNKTSGMKYSDVYDDTDLEYILTSSSLKENIVVNKAKNKYEYKFNADFGGLVPKNEGDGSIGLYKSVGNTQVLEMYIEAPYMYDANGEISKDVSISFSQAGKKYKITVTANKEWVNADDRKFPVVIDPTVKLDVSRSDIKDTYVDTSSPSTNFQNDYYLYVGYNSLGKTRTYIKYILPDLPDCSIVTGASLVLQQYEYDPGSGASNYIYAYDCGNNSWDISTITWNNQPMNTSSLSSYTVLDYQAYQSNPTGYCAAYAFDITKAAKRWYEDGVNNGIMLASSDESVTKRSRFCSANYSTDSQYFPSVWVAYVNNTGIEDYWTYKTVDLGRSGMTYVSDYNGSFTYIHNDAATAGNRMQASVNHVYSNDKTYFGGTYGNMKLGIGFRFDLLEKVELISNSGDYTSLYEAGYRLKYIDSDGTVHYFKSTSTANKYEHEFDSNLTVTKLDSGRYQMEDDSENKKVFSAGGYLLTVTDANSNTVTITYSNNQITTLTDGAGKKITFEYNSSNFLTAIKDPAGRATTFNYDGNYLRYIGYPDGKTTYFYYGNAGARISQIVAHDTSTVLFTLKNVTSKSKTFYRIHTVETLGQLPSGGTRTTINKLTYIYTEGQTIIYDKVFRTNYISFDNAGRTVNIRDHANNASYAKYNTSGNKTNTLSLASDTYSSINNLAKNHSAELTGSEWYQQLSGTGAAGSTSISTDQYHIGYKSFSVTSTSLTGRVNYCQAFTGVPGTTYTLSAYTKLVENMGDGTGGASIGFVYKNADGVWMLARGDYITNTQDWHRESYTFTLPSDAPGNMGIVLMILNNTGTVYFDSVQLEESSVVNRYNLLNNSGFNYNASYWTYTASGTSDGIVDGFNDNGVRLYGAPASRKNIYQNVQINGKSGDTIVYGGWAMASAAGKTNSNSSSTQFKVTLTIYYTDGTVAYASELFNAHVVTAQYVCSSIKLTKDCNYIRYYLTYYNDVNNVIFDDACLYIDNFGASYQYDSDGKLTSVTDGTGVGLSYTYDGPDVTKISQKFDGVENESCTYTYDDKHNILTETTKGGVVTQYDYTAQSGTSSTFGNPTKVTIKSADGTLQSSCRFVYTSDYDYLTSVIDSRNGTTTYNYNIAKGLLNSVTDANGNTTTYTYDANTDALLSTSGNANATTPVTSSYSYSNDRLSSITHNGFSYGFNYDTFGRLTSTSAAGQTLINHTYRSDGNLSSSAYGNGDTVSYTYDDLDRVTSNSYNGVKTYEYFYNKEGLLAKEKDNENSVTTDYEYDFARRLSASTSSNGVKANYTYDERNNIKSLKMKKNGETLSDTDFEYTTDGLLSYVSWSTLESAYRIHSYDSLNRPTKKSMYLFAPLYAHYGEINYYHTYLSNGTNETGLISQIKYTRYFEDHYFLGYGEFDVRTLDYTYDANGNIKTVTTDGVLTDSYTYDGLNQLVRHDNSAAGKSYVYSYDAGGNITSKKEYAYTTGTLGMVLSTKSYAYDSVWKDKLVSYDGKAITYDTIGNPLTYDGYTFSWQKGRQLASIDGNGVSLDFKYNSDGLRTKKISSDKTIEYYYSGDVLIAQYDGTEWMKFCYSADGEIVGFSYDNDPYYFIKNAQGDIIGILDRSAESVCTYEYDAWGNCTVYGSSGSINTSSTFIGNINPIRYRGYYYDAETNLYYVSSRYYEPEFGRFLNADAINLIAESPMGTTDKNLFSYCDNNPIIRFDESGKVWYIAVGKVALGVASQYAGDIILNAIQGKTGWEILKPQSSAGEYIAAGFTALIPGSGLGKSFASNLASEGILIIETVIKGDEVSLKTSINNVFIGTAFDSFTDMISKGMKKTIYSSNGNYSTYAGKQYKKNPNISRSQLDFQMRTRGTIIRSILNTSSFVLSTLKSLVNLF